MLIAMSALGQSSPVFDNDVVAELLYPLAMKKVVLEAGQDPYKQKDVKISQTVSITAGLGVMPANVVLECLDTAKVTWGGSPATFDGSGDVNTTTNRITIVGHGYQTGIAVQFEEPPPDPLVAGRIYYLDKFDDDAFYVCSTRANAINSVRIDITGTYAETMGVYPLGEADTVSFVPYAEDVFRAGYAEFSYWSADKGNLYFSPSGAALPRSFTGTVSFSSVVFPIINSNNIQIVAGTNLAEDIIDDIVRELASAIRQEVTVKSLA